MDKNSKKQSTFAAKSIQNAYYSRFCVTKSPLFPYYNISVLMKMHNIAT